MFKVESNHSRMHVAEPRDANTAYLVKKYLTVYIRVSYCYHILSQLNLVHITFYIFTTNFNAGWAKSQLT